MSVRKWTRVGSVAAAIAAMMLAGIGPAQAQTGDKPPPTAPSGPTVSAPDQPGASRAVAAPPGSEAALAAMRARIAAQVAKKGNKYTFASYLDGLTGKIVLETDAPAALVSTLVAPLPSTNATERTAAAQTVVRTTTIKDSARLNDTRPFYGGGGIYSSGAGYCSSGYTVYSSVSGYFMVTAGHCYAEGAAVYTETGGVYYGNAGNRRLESITHDGKDLELLGNQSYAGRIFVGNTTSSTTKGVVSAGAASVGSSYCFSGRTSGETCGHTVNSLNAQVCTETGCKSPVISYTGGALPQGGDSGSPFYINSGSGVSIRGHIIAGSSSSGFVEPWTVLAGTFNVSIVTG